jgi:hypothetical protein
MYCYWSCRNIYAENTVLRNADVINSNLSRFGPNNECTAPCSETMRLLCFALRIARFPLPSLRSEKICLCMYIYMSVRVRFLYRTIGQATRNQSGSDCCFRIRILLVVFLPVRKRIVYSALCLSVRPLVVFLLFAAMYFDGTWWEFSMQISE